MVTELYPPGLNHAELHKSTGDMDLGDLWPQDAPMAEGLYVRKTVTGDDEYGFSRFITISEEGCALVDNALSGLVVMGIHEAGDLSGGLAIFSGLNVWALAYEEATLSGGAWGCIAAFQYHPASTVDLRHGLWVQHSVSGRTMQSVLMMEVAGGGATHLIEMGGSGVTNFAALPDNDVIAGDTKNPGTTLGFIRVLVGASERYIQLYSVAPS